MNVRLKDVVATNRKALPESTLPEFSFRYVDISAVSQGRIDVPDEILQFETAPSRARRLAEPGDTVVSTVRTYLRAVARVPNTPDPLVFSTGFAVLHPIEDRIDSRYLSYYCASAPFIDSIVARSVGVSYPAINASEVADVRLGLPPLDEQRRIADFLDTETARVDRVLLTVQRQVHLAAVRLQAFVERRTWFDVDAPAMPLRRFIARLKTGSTPPTEGRDYSQTEGIGWLSPGSIGEMLTIGEPARVLDPAALSDGVVPPFAADSVVIVGIGATAGRIGHLRAPATGNQQLTAIATGPALSARFLAWQLWSRTEELRALAPYTTLPIIGNDYLKSVLVRVPSLERQHEIVTEIDATASRAEQLSHYRERAALLLNERRQALITAAVTGQLDVTTARGGRS